MSHFFAEVYVFVKSMIVLSKNFVNICLTLRGDCYNQTMAFNHYAKIKAILATQPAGWYIQRINEPTSAKTFKGETKYYDHYYRIYGADNAPIKYCKFQQLERLASVLNIPAPDLPVIE